MKGEEDPHVRPDPQEPKPFPRPIEWALTKLPETGRNEARTLLRHPVQWFKGTGGGTVPEGHLNPWEKMLFFFNTLIDTSVGGFNGQDLLFRQTYHVNPNHLTLSGLVTSAWDALNDPLVGTWMDRHPQKDSTHRWVVRLSHIFITLLNFLLLLDLGLSPVGHVLLLTVVAMVRDVFYTTREISFTKYFAGITPFSNERGKTMVWGNVGRQIGYNVANIPAIIMGFARDRMQFSDYKIYVYGSLILMPFALGAWVVHTFARNRVTFNGNVSHAEGAEQNEDGELPKMSLRESFSVLKYNRYLILNTIASFITVFTPTSNEWLIYRYLVPPIKLGDREMRGEGLIWFRKMFTGLPISILYPFVGMITNKAGGPKRMHILNSIAQIVGYSAMFFAGPASKLGLAVIFIADTFFQTIGPFDGYAGGVLDYEMLDYVEYKTGVRSEGITMAFKAFFNKIVTGNLNNATANYFEAWSGINTVNYTEGAKPTPRYAKWGWTVFTMAPVMDSVVWLITRLLFKYDPKQKDFIELELRERHRLEAELKQAAESD